VLHDPIQKRLLETDIVACLLTLDPFVPKDFFAFRQELFVKERVFDEVGVVVDGGAHAGGSISPNAQAPSMPQREVFTQTLGDLKERERNEVLGLRCSNRHAAVTGFTGCDVDWNLGEQRNFEPRGFPRPTA